MPEMVGGYDRAIVTFAPDGRLFQVEYAREAVKRGTTSLGVTFQGGVVLAARRIIQDLGVPNAGSGKVHQVDDNLGVVMAGFLADGRVLIDLARVKAQIYKITYDEPMNVLGCVKEISDRMQLYTQFGGVRPFGVALLVAGFDESGSQLFEIDTSSAFYSWHAQAIGMGAADALKVLKREWKEKLKQDEAISLAISALKAAERGVKLKEVELAIINDKGFKKWEGEEGIKFIKKFW